MSEPIDVERLWGALYEAFEEEDLRRLDDDDIEVSRGVARRVAAAYEKQEEA